MTRTLSIFGALALVAASVYFVAPAATKDKEDKKADTSVECRRATGKITIDGKLDENSWKSAQEISDFRVGWQDNRKAKTATTASLVWDDEALYFAATMTDADLYALVEKHNGMTWNDDVFELFFKPGGEGKVGRHYYEFQVNARGTLLELFMPSRGAGGYERAKIDKPMGMKAVVALRGTLNDWTDSDKGWTVEGSIPWTAFASTGGRPKAGARWRFALCRYDYSADFESPELSSTAKLKIPSFHQYEDYGELHFVGEAP